MQVRDLPRLLRTVSHLHASQVWHRARLTLRRRRWSRNPGRVDARYAARAARAGSLRWDHPGLAAMAQLHADRRDAETAHDRARDALVGSFTLLGETREVATGLDRHGAPRIAWDRPDLMQALLWKTHLHEFPFAIDLAMAWQATGERRFRAAFFALARGWTEKQPIGRPGFHRVAWNERVVATRLVHWSVAGALLGLRAGDPDADWLGREIARHALFLRDNLALDLLGNHLFRDRVGLAVADVLIGCVPGAIEQLERECARQILPDGAHEERCPMYHAVCLADLLDLRALLGDAAPAWLRDTVARAAGFLESVLLGDGDIPLLGDGWRGEIEVARLLAQAGALEKPIAPYEPERWSGIVALERGAARCVVRAGPHGPDHQLGHAHADLLSFDLSVGSVRVVTDTGTGAYAAGPMRTHLRSTAAHNTVQLDGEELLEAWSSFRSGRRGRARVVARGETGRFAWLWAEHDGYAWLRGAPRPQRLWLLAEEELFVLDAVLGGGERRHIVSRLHLHPDAPRGWAAVRTFGGRTAERTAPLHERFGTSRPMRQVAVEADVELPWTGGFWQRFGPGDDARPTLALEGHVVRLQRDPPGQPLAVVWDLAAPGAAAVGVEEPC